MIKIAPSVLAADHAKLGEEIISIKNADYVHFDVMDGVFVPNLSFGFPVLEAVKKVTDMPLDVHLMIDKPSQYVKRFAKAGADIITFHVESEEAEKSHFTIKDIHDAGKKAGMSIRPGTPVEALLPYIDKLDLVLVMTVEPGYGGQAFMSETLPKIAEVRSIIINKNLDCELEVDGGINPETARLCINAGANVLVAGSDVFRAADRKQHIENLRSAERGES
jgi:ribulose-phosphate 3-epimerase